MREPKKIIHYDPSQAGALHCDACGYDLPERRAFTADLIGTPCPKCGADMLTRSDYEKTARMFRALDWINRIFGPIFGVRVSDLPKGKMVDTVSVHMHDDTTTIKHLGKRQLQ